MKWLNGDKPLVSLIMSIGNAAARSYALSMTNQTPNADVSVHGEPLMACCIAYHLESADNQRRNHQTLIRSMWVLYALR